jgi:hypothetical protein
MGSTNNQGRMRIPFDLRGRPVFRGPRVMTHAQHLPHRIQQPRGPRPRRFAKVELQPLVIQEGQGCACCLDGDEGLARFSRDLLQKAATSDSRSS